MKRTLFLGIVAAFTLLTLANGVRADVASNADDSSAPKTGELTLTKVDLPAATGSAWQGSDELDETKTETKSVWVFLPTAETAKSDAGFPLIFFLHGAGERGADPEKVKVHGPPKLLGNADFAKKFPFVVIAPQCPDKTTWSPKQLRVLLDDVCEKYPIDRSRIYVTGVSMGGFATWALLANSSDVIAAAAPICGWFPVEAAPKMTAPIWAFHGEADPLVPCDASRKLVEALKKVGNDDVRLTTYPSVGHDSWTQTYDNPELFDWFLSKVKE